MDIYRYSNGSLSIKDMKDVCIEHESWRPAMNFLIEQSNGIYFLGERAYGNIIRDAHPEFKVLVQNDEKLFIKFVGQLSIYDLSIVGKLWSAFEFPALIGLSYLHYESDLYSLIYSKDVSYQQIAERVFGCIILHMSFESNVLWLKKNQSIVNFPF